MLIVAANSVTCQIDNIRYSKLGTKVNEINNPKQNNKFLKLLDILETAVKETNAINDKLCHDILPKSLWFSNFYV